MWRKTRFLLVMALLLAGSVHGQPLPQTEPRPSPGSLPPLLDVEALAKQAGVAAMPAISDHTLVMRIYPNMKDAPERFVKVNIRLDGDRIRFGAIKAEYPSIILSTPILALAGDQSDPGIAAVLEHFVYVDTYSPDQQPSLLAIVNSRRSFEPQWTFVDARNKPIAEASVTISLAMGGAEIPLGKATLDEQGRTPRMLSNAGSFVLRVAHPNYGMATVEYGSSQEEPSGLYMVPLVPLDSDAVRSSVQGTVVDSDGNAVPNAFVSCGGLVKPDGSNGDLHPRIISRAVTDDRGWFALCVPLVTEKLEWKGWPEPGSAYELGIEPPKASNLRWPSRYGHLRVLAGVRQTFVLARMDAQEFFHTFSFEYTEGPLTDPDELKKTELILMRDAREWMRLTYEQWKDGCSLPSGTLRASTQRWGEPFSFGPVNLTATSPEHLVIKTLPPILYRGQVVDEATGAPIPGALVLAWYAQDLPDPCSLTEGEWRQLREAAARQMADDSPQAPYYWRDRMVVTDAQGRFEIPFRPGWNDELYAFTALAPGYDRSPPCPAGPRDSPEVVTRVFTIRLSPRNPTPYCPTFVFEDENGPVTDPNRLQRIRIEYGNEISTVTGWYNQASLKSLPIYPGIYRADVMWGGKHYVFAPVDLRQARPGTIVFRPQKIESPNVTYTGRVVHGITGAPIAGAVVMYCRAPMEQDASGLTDEQWAAIRALGPQVSAAESDLVPLLSALVGRSSAHGQAMPQPAVTDRDGRFTLRCMLSYENSFDQLLAVAQDFLGTQQQLALPVPAQPDGSGQRERRRLEPDSNGVVTIPPLKLFPAGTVIVRPVPPDVDHAGQPLRLRFRWVIPGENPPAWVKDLHHMHLENPGASVPNVCELRPNVAQTMYVPAGANLTLALLLLLPQSPWPPVYVRGITLAQGQVLDLGRLEFQPGLEVLVKVLDRQGNPRARVPVYAVDESGLSWSVRQLTDASGIVKVRVPSRSTGKFSVWHFDRQTLERQEENVTFAVGAEEDAGKEFTLSLSDEFIAALRREESR
jgi:protocatechuate 3,4-dioxygenase beta subunit